MKKLFFFTLIVSTAFMAQGQNFSKIQLKLRQSFQSEDTKPEPAALTFTKPSGAKASFLVDGALGLKIVNQPTFGLTFFGEYHRNTLITTPQNTIQGGLAAEWFTNKKFNINDERKNSTTTIINLNTKYSRDVVAKTHSLQFAGEITPLFLRKDRKNALLPNDDHNHIGKAFDLVYYPAIGLEDQYTFQAKNDSARGNVLRAVGKIYVGIKPLPELLKSRIELFADFKERYNLQNSTDYRHRNFAFIQTGINFILFQTDGKFAKIGASFNKGANPSQGLTEQEYYLISLKVKI
jgi:hypothetical protein